MTSRSHHPGSAAEMAGGATMTLTIDRGHHRGASRGTESRRSSSLSAPGLAIGSPRYQRQKASAKPGMCPWRPLSKQVLSLPATKLDDGK
jgi:hypothetical protein